MNLDTTHVGGTEADIDLVGPKFDRLGDPHLHLAGDFVLGVGAPVRPGARGPLGVVRLIGLRGLRVGVRASGLTDFAAGV